VAYVACDLELDGSPLEHGPRHVLKKILKEMEASKGYHLKTGVECEFFLLDPDTTKGVRWSDAMDTQAKPCYDAHALMRQYDVVTQLSESMESLGWGPYQMDHEDGNGQFEINWDFSDALNTADRVVFFKYMARSVAENYGLRATFMPKPFANITGNGSHMHMSLWKGDKDITGCDEASITDANHSLSSEGLDFLGGLLANAPGLAALSNPTVNSYKRLYAPTTASGATWSPNLVCWSGNNRTVMVRVPGSPRMELRVGDLAANPYLFAAGVAAAGLDSQAPPPPSDVNMYDHANPETMKAIARAKKLPSNLGDALKLFKDNAAMQSLGPELASSYYKLRQAHWEEFNAHLSTWEIQQYLDC